MEIKKTPKNAKKNVCNKCNFSCSKYSDWNRHIMTQKHKMEINGNNGNEKNAEKHYCDECSKEFQTKSGLWKHMKGCKKRQKTPEFNNLHNCKEEIPNLNNNQALLNTFLTKNNEFTKELVDKIMTVLPQIASHSTNTNSLNNSYNTNTFNVSMFLNDQCKNAMNLTDFIESLPITAETFDHTIQNGLTKTLTHMITNGLNKLDILERPIHCTYVSRKTIYVKENNIWEKDTDLDTTISGIKTLSVKQRTNISKWQDANEGWEKKEDLQTKLTTLVCNSMSDVENNEKEINKIIRSISKQVYLDNDKKNNIMNNNYI